MVDQLILQSLLDLQRGRTLAVAEQPLRQGRVQSLIRQAVIQVCPADVLAQIGIVADQIDPTALPCGGSGGGYGP